MKRLLSTLIIGLTILGQTVAPVTTVQAEAPVLSEVGELAVQQSHLLWQLKEKLAQTEYRLFLLGNNVEYAEDGLTQAKEAIRLVKLDIKKIERELSEKKRQILNVKGQMETRRIEVQELEQELSGLSEQLGRQKALVGELMSLIYFKKGLYFNEGNVNAVKVLASEDSVSETLQTMTYLKLIERENQSQIEELNQMSEDMNEKWGMLHKKRSALERLDETLAEEELEIIARLEEKQFFLNELEGERAVLESMILSADDQEEDLRNQMEIYKKNVKMMHEKLASTLNGLSPEELSYLEQLETEQFNNFSLQSLLSSVDFASPLAHGIKSSNNPDSKLELTAYFDNAGYRALFGVNHYAIDLRAYERTPILAIADGVVEEVIWDETSTLYAYVKVTHRNGMSSVYGHIKSPEVSIGDLVHQGEIIAYTGGSPGTPGAGARTTGPHLHLELWSDGLRVDPMDYFPLNMFLAETLEEDRLEELQEQLEDSVRESANI